MYREDMDSIGRKFVGRGDFVLLEEGAMLQEKIRIKDYISDNKENPGVVGTLILLTAFLGQIYFRPFSEYFRFSLSVPALSLILLYFPGGSPVIYSTIAGAAMLVFRTIIAFLSQGDQTLPALVAQNMSVFVFYIVFGVLFSLLHIRDKTDKTLLLHWSLWVCEVVANLADLATTGASLEVPLERAVYTIILVGGVRSGATVAIYKLSLYFLRRYELRQREERYCHMALFFSNIKKDLLFFKKSAVDIENAMKLSYGLYEKLKDSSLQSDSLSIARNIHEIKKDYQRIFASMEKALSDEYEESPMQLSEILYILERNTQSLLAAKNCKANVRFFCRDDWVAGQFYMIMSVINNLVVNAIEAMAGCDASGQITVTQWSNDSGLFLEVRDNGPGIGQELLEYIFEPGFTTKFDPETGEMSSGIGLVHVKYIVEEIYGGTITVSSQKGDTVFLVHIPADTRKEGASTE